MIPYTNVHLAAEQMRVRAYRASRGSPPLDAASGSGGGESQQDTRAPRILVIGPENGGKTTATKILANYAIRSPGEWVPLIINLDPNDVSHGSTPSTCGHWTSPL